MIQIIAKLDEIFSQILNMSWLYHFNSIWKVPFLWFHKKDSDEIFHSNKHKCDIDKKNCWKISVIWTITRIMLKAFVSISILYVYQKARWNQIKIILKIILNVLKIIHFLAQNGLSIVCFHPRYIHANLNLDDAITIFWFHVNIKN
jgi:hypothetical protein